MGSMVVRGRPKPQSTAILANAKQAKPQGQWDVNRNCQLQAPAKQP